MEALGNRVIIKPDPVKKETDWGFQMGGDDYERDEKVACTTGAVIDYGPAAWLDPIMGGKPWVEKGDRVVYAKYAGKFIKNPEDGEEYVVVNDDAIQVRI